MAERVGLIAGLGRFPFEVARSVREKGGHVVGVAIQELAEKDIERELDACHWVHLGQLAQLVATFREEGVRDLVMAGKVPKTFLFEKAESLKPDATALALLAGLRDRKDDSILGAVADFLESEGFRLRGQTELAPELLAGPGPLGRHALTPEQQEDVCFAWPIARSLGGLDVGQTVVVRHGAVMALEAMEGTDAAVRRGAALSGPGCCVVKLAKPAQDPRFDVPTVGLGTLRVLVETAAAVLAVEAERTVVLEREALVEMADAAGVVVVGVSGGEQAELPA
jgi:DUF1009 family protein